jgi:co-chaperonin GroES (HSP10)
MIACDKIVPLHDGVIVTEMNFDEQVTKSGIVISSDNGKTEGIKPRWGKVVAIGKDQHTIKVGDWILVEHGRWTRGIKIKVDSSEIHIRRVETKSIILVGDEKPNDVYLGESNNSQSQEFDFSKPMF